MAQLGNYQVGMLKSTPKLTKINGDDNVKVIWRNMGNNHAYPFVWADTVTMASGTVEVVVASGVKFHGLELAGVDSDSKSLCNITITPLQNPGARGFWVEKNAGTNVIKIKSTAVDNNLDYDFDVKYMLGAENVAIAGMNCDGMWSGMPPTGYRN